MGIESEILEKARKGESLSKQDRARVHGILEKLIDEVCTYGVGMSSYDVYDKDREDIEALVPYLDKKELEWVKKSLLKDYSRPDIWGIIEGCQAPTSAGSAVGSDITEQYGFNEVSSEQEHVNTTMLDSRSVTFVGSISDSISSH